MLCNWYGNSNSGLSLLPSSTDCLSIIVYYYICILSLYIISHILDPKTSGSGKTEHSICMNATSHVESFRSCYLHVASMSSGPSLLKDLAALKWTAGSPRPTTLPKAWLEGRKGCDRQYAWLYSNHKCFCKIISPKTTLEEKAKMSLSSTRRTFLTQTAFPSFFSEAE